MDEDTVDMPTKYMDGAAHEATVTIQGSTNDLAKNKTQKMDLCDSETPKIRLGGSVEHSN